LKMYKADWNIAYYRYGRPCTSAKVHMYDEWDWKTQ